MFSTILFNSLLPILLGLLILIVVFLFLSKPWQYLSPLSRQTGCILLGIVLLGIFFRLEQPLQHYLFFDEDYYLNAARTISLGDFQALDPFLKKNGYELLLAIVFFFSGKSAELAAFGLNLGLGILTIPVVFLLTREFWSESAAIIAAGLLAILPEHIRWSAATSLEVPAIFFALSSLLVFFIFLKSKNYLHFILALLISIYLSFIRPEMILVAGFELLYLLFNSELLALAWKNLRHKLFSGITLILFLFSGALTLLSLKIWENIWVVERAATLFSLNYFSSNLWDIIRYNFQIYNFLFFILIITWFFGFYQIWQNRNFRKPATFISTLFLTLFFYYNAYFYGGYGIGTTVHSRFAAIWLAWAVILAGIGLDWFLQLINKKNSFKIGLFLLILFSVYSQLNFGNFFPESSQAWAVREREAMISFAQENQSCLYVAIFPYPLNFHGFNAVSVNNFDPSTKAPCIMFWESISCKYEDQPVCTVLLKNSAWEKLTYQPVNIWQYSLTKDQYTATIPAFTFRPAKTIFSLIKSHL